MPEQRIYLDEMATVEKIMNGDMPEGDGSIDRIIVISDDVARIYVNLLAKVLLNSIPDDAEEELINNRVELFDGILALLNSHRICRLYTLIGALTQLTEPYNKNMICWTSTKSKNNTLTFIHDFWIWSPEERAGLLVMVDEKDIEELSEQDSEE